MRVSARRCAGWVIITAACAYLAACGDDAHPSPMMRMDAGDAEIEAGELPDVYLPEAPDAEDPYDFEPAESPDPIEAMNPFEPPPDAGPPSMPPDRPRNCLVLRAGDEVDIDGELTADRTWLRIEPDMCPATLVTAREVAFDLHAICADDEDVTVELVMLGADRLDPSVAPSGVADPALVVYEEASTMDADPFACLAANDDAAFDDGLSNSARIDALQLQGQQRVVVVATSYERPEEHGIGSYVLRMRAQ